MHAIDLQQAPPIETLLYKLLSSCSQRVDDDLVERVIADVTTEVWTDRLQDAAERVGLRVRWMSATPAEASALARPDLPVVTACTDALGQPTWWLLDGTRPAQVRASRLDDPRGARWITPSNLAGVLGDSERPWALVEPLMPASPMAGKPGQPTPTPLARLAGLLQIERDDLGVVVAYAVAIGVLSLAIPLAMQVLINWLAFGALLQPVLVLGVALFVFLALAGVLRTLQRQAVETVQRRVFVRMAADIASRLSRADIRSFDRAYGPELMNRFFDVLTVQKALRSLVLDGLAAMLQAMVGLLLLALYHPVLLVFDVVVLGAIAFVWFPLGRGAADSAIRESKVKYEVAAWIEEMARQPMLFKLGGSRIGTDRADRLARAYLQARHSHFSIFMRQYVGMQMVQVLVSTSLLVLCGWLVLEGQLTLGQLVAAEFIVTAALAGLAKFTDKLDTWYDLLAAVDKLGTLVDLPRERVTGLVRPAPDWAASVKLEDVGFSYPNVPGGLNNLSLSMPPRSRTAIVGASGSGKSQLADLVLGVRTPTTGQIRRDGIDVRALHPDTLHRDAALLRGTALIAGSIRDNVALGRPGIDTETVLRSLEKVGLNDVLGRLPDGIETPLSPSGAPLSRGQVQALMVARVLAAAPRLLVVDGFFDGAGRSTRDTLLAPLLASDAPFTLLVLTEDDTLARHLDHIHELTQGGLHERPRLAPV